MKREEEELIRRYSHEVRTPLNAIIGLSYLSRECKDVPEMVQDNLNKIEQSAQYLLSFMNDILSLSDLTSGKIALEYDTVDMKDYLTAFLGELWALAEERQVHFEAEVSEGLDVFLVIDEKRLSEALRLVFLNSLKAIPAGGTMKAGVQVLEDTAEEVKVLFSLSDNGIGIEEAVLPKVFEPFCQIYGDSRTLYSGSGLELAITKNIVELMKGEIRVSSKKGEGTTFYIQISLKKERRKETRPKARKSKACSYDFTGKRALVVEDSDINIEIARNILLHKNFEVEIALNGEEAVSAFKAHEAGYYDLILMDIRMPVMNGLEATEQIRRMEERPDGKTIPIIAMTANAFEEDVKKSLEAGMNRHLSKPIDIKKMYALIDEVLSDEE